MAIFRSRNDRSIAFVVFMLVSVLLQLSPSTSEAKPDLSDDDWDKFKNQFNKKYRNESEEHRRCVHKPVDQRKFLLIDFLISYYFIRLVLY